MNEDFCPICSYDRIIKKPSYDIHTDDSLTYCECPRCGKFEIIARLNFNKIDTKLRPKISGWILDQNKIGIEPQISADTIEKIKNLPDINIMEKSNRLLLYAVQNSTFYGSSVNLALDHLIATTYSKNLNEVFYLVKMLREKDLLKLGNGEQHIVTPNGYVEAEKLEKDYKKFTQAFIAMSFDHKMDTTSNAIHAGISQAGYTPMRVDRVEHLEKIDDKIIGEINKSKFLVADFTGHKTGVYFEAGYALGRGIPVLWTCKKEELSGLHFDIRQYNCIDWSSENELTERLLNRIKAYFN